jgi:hypothetical protein
LPSLRFGRSYRVRARAVDLSGNSLALADPVTDALATAFGTPREPEGFPYLRFEPVVAPVIVLRDPEGVSSPGSAIDRLVLRTFSDSEAKDGDAADLTGSQRHIVPPRPRSSSPNGSACSTMRPASSAPIRRPTT